MRVQSAVQFNSTNEWICARTCRRRHSVSHETVATLASSMCACNSKCDQKQITHNEMLNKGILAEMFCYVAAPCVSVKKKMSEVLIMYILGRMPLFANSVNLWGNGKLYCHNFHWFFFLQTFPSGDMCTVFILTRNNKNVSLICTFAHLRTNKMFSRHKFVAVCRNFSCNSYLSCFSTIKSFIFFEWKDIFSFHAVRNRILSTMSSN